MKFCPKCQMQFPDEAKFCGNCGTPLEIPKPKEGLKYCPQCGKEIIKGTKFCVGCGAPLPIGEQALSVGKEAVYTPPQYQRPIQPTYVSETEKDLAKKYDNYGIICGILGFLFFIPIGSLGVYYGLKARNFDRTKIWGIAISGIGIALSFFLSLCLFPYVFHDILSGSTLFFTIAIELLITLVLIWIVVVIVSYKYPRRW